MRDIICPNCGKAFQVDETGYADILKQVRDEEFDKQLHERLELAEREALARVEKAELAKELSIKQSLDEAERSRDRAIQDLEALRRESAAALELAQSEAQKALESAASARDLQIQDLRAKLEASATARQLAVREAVG